MATTPAAKKSAAKKSAAKKSQAKKAAATKAPVKKAAAKKAPAKKAPAKKAPAKKAAATKAPAKKVAAKKAPAKKATPTKAAARKAPATKAPAKKAAGTKAPAKKVAAKKAPATKAASKKAPAEKATSPYDAKFLEEMRKALLEERAKYTHTAEVAKADADALAEMREPGDVQFDDESGEGDTLAVERDFELAMSAQARHTVDEIDHALATIDAGTYGLCETSDLPIPKERLRALPWARKRVEHQVGSFGNR